MLQLHSGGKPAEALLMAMGRKSKKGLKKDVRSTPPRQVEETTAKPAARDSGESKTPESTSREADQTQTVEAVPPPKKKSSWWCCGGDREER